jgi:Mg-chelatase subunit ChlD
MKLDLETVLKHGKPVPCKYGNAYRYKDITYVVDYAERREKTCYAVPVPLKRVEISGDKRLEHRSALKKLQNPASWQSNTVIVVDTSGSMNKADVWGARSRLDAVWLSVALDFIAHRLETGSAGLYDVISIVSLGNSAEVIVETQPTSWLLYNEIADIYQNKKYSPKSHGNYIPSLEAAEEILTRNKSASCALAVCFISDGKPSDGGRDVEGRIMEAVESLGKRFGRRLTLATVGIGSNPDEFHMLRSMAEAAKDYGVQASFELPSMTSAALADVLTATATSLTKTQTEMTDMTTLKQRNVRDVLRESRKKASEEVVQHVSKDDYFIYPINKVDRHVYREWYDDERRRHDSYDSAPMQHPEAGGVVLKKAAFGEGAERFAFRFFEVAADGETVVGRPLVAKESRLVLEEGDRSREKFVRTFCRTQQLARRIADEFNKKLDSLRRVDKGTPRVTFLDCSVYELDDKSRGKQSVLVEEKLDHMVWHKWNANNGFIEGMKEAPEFTYDKLRNAMDHLTNIDLGAIEEGEEEEESEHNSLEGRPKIISKKFTPSEVAQAFSHFSYYATGKKRLICDLQGVFDEKENILKFSDPVIHYYNSGRLERRSVHGRTDLGREGMAMFFETHKDCCGHLCRLVTGGFKRQRDRRTGH